MVEGIDFCVLTDLGWKLRDMVFNAYHYYYYYYYYYYSHCAGASCAQNPLWESVPRMARERPLNYQATVRCGCRCYTASYVALYTALHKWPERAH